MSDKAKVKLGGSYKINVGNYENVTLNVGVEIEGDKENLPELWQEAEKEVAEQMNEQVRGFKKRFSDRLEHTILMDGEKPDKSKINF